MLFGPIISSPRGTLSLDKALRLARFYLEHAREETDSELFLVLCRDTEVSMSQAKKAARRTTGRIERKEIVAIYTELGALLDTQGYSIEAKAFRKKAMKWSGRPPSGAIECAKCAPHPATNTPAIEQSPLSLHNAADSTTNTPIYMRSPTPSLHVAADSTMNTPVYMRSPTPSLHLAADSTTNTPAFMRSPTPSLHIAPDSATNTPAFMRSPTPSLHLALDSITGTPAFVQSPTPSFHLAPDPAENISVVEITPPTSPSLVPHMGEILSVAEPSLASVARFEQTTDIAAQHRNIFPRNVSPPVIIFKPPEPDTPLDDTPQLACCLSLLQSRHDPDDISDAATRNWLQTTKSDFDEQDRLKALATDVIRAFKRDELKDGRTVAEVVHLAPVLGKSDFRYLVKEFHSGIEQSSLLDIHQLEGLAQLIKGADPGYLQADDLVNILKLLYTRLSETHQQSAELVRKLTLAVSNVLDAMADANVKDLDREKLHEPLSLYLDGLKTSADPYLIYQAAYAYQALLCVPDNESLWQSTARRTGKVINGVSGLVSAVKGLDLIRFIEGLKDIQQGVAGSSRVVRTVLATYNAVTSLAESGQGFFDSLREAFSFNRKFAWYSALRGADVLIRDGQLAQFRKFVYEAPCRRDPAFQWGVCQRLGDMASNAAWDVETRRSAIAFLGDIYKDDDVWGYQATVKQWILGILMQLSTRSDDDMQSAKNLLHELEGNGDVNKQELYRACQEDGLGFYPLKIALPTLVSPSLLDRVQNREDVEANLRLLRRQRLKERGNAVYIPPQAKPSLQAPDASRFPLMETVKDFVHSDQQVQQVFLVLGESGAGKSTFNCELEYELWGAYEKKTGLIPLYINLPVIDKPEHDMITKQLRKVGFTEPQIRELKLYRKFILICDGYDESQQLHNLYTSNRLNQAGEWKAKMVISCRSEYLGVDYRDRFQPGGRNQLSSQALLQEAVISPFSADQVQDYINQYVSIHQPLWEARQYINVLNHIPSLKELVKNPFLMSLSLEVLPQMVDPGQDHSATRITRVAIYDHFIEHWLERGKKRLGEKNLSNQMRATFDSLSDEGFTQNAMHFLKNLCVAIYKEHCGQSVVQYSQYRDENSWKAKFFSREDEKQLLREACPLTRSGNQHQFIHRSLLEYGLTLAVFDPQDRKTVKVPDRRLPRRQSTGSVMSFIIHDAVDDATVAMHSRMEPDINSPLVWRSFVKDPSVLQFLEERVQQEPLFKQLLIDYIEHSKTDKKWRTAAANAITILVRAGVQFNQADLQGIQIPGADLSHGVFESAQLQGADLRHVNLRGAWLTKADLTKAHMKGVQFGELPFLEHHSAVISSTYSPDGKSFAVGLKDGHIIVYSTRNWEPLWESNTHEGDIWSLSYSPKNDFLVSGGGDKTIRIWDMSTGGCCRTLIGHEKAVTCVAFSPQYGQVASASKDNTLRLWDVDTGECQYILSGHAWPASYVTFSPTGDQIASSCSWDMTVRLWDTATGECSHTLAGHTDFVNKVVYSPKGDQVASASYDKLVRLWDTATGTCIHILNGHTKHVRFAVYSPQGEQVATSSSDNTVRLWDVKTGKCRHTIPGHTKEVNSVIFSPQGGLVASASNDGTVRIWDAEAGTHRQTLFSDGDKVTSVAFSPGGDQITTGSYNNNDKTVRLWDVEAGTSRHLSSGHTDRVNCVVYSPTGNQAASCGDDIAIRLWDVETGVCQYTLTGHTRVVNWIAYSPQGDGIASASGDGTVRLWDVQSGKCLRTLRKNLWPIFYVTYSPTGHQIASCGADKMVRLWDPSSRKCRLTLSGHEDFVRNVVYSRQGDQVASVSDDGSVRLWNSVTGACLHAFTGPEAGIGSVAYSLRGDQVVIAAHDMTMCSMDIETVECRHMLCEVDKVAHSPRGGVVASGSDDGTVRLWDIESEGCLHILIGHTESGVLHVQFSPQGDQVAAVSEDRTIRLWNVASGRCRAVIQGHSDINSIAWNTDLDIDHLVVGFDDGSIAMWRVMDDGNSNHVRLRWRTTKGGLSVKNALIQDARGLNQANRKLLEQRGAVSKPVISR